tara:strand:+ start:1681 stop:1971 length:291 start_codon:yes stop_codon:yes gene_type:complete
VLFAIDLHEDFIDVESITIASVFSLQSWGVNGSEFDTPKTHRFAADSDTSLSQEIFDIAVAQIESIVEPDGVGNDIGRESVAFICIHSTILTTLTS